MKRFLSFLFLALFAAGLFVLPGRTLAADKMSIYDFWSKYCPHCRDENAYLEKLKKQRPDIEILSYEVTSDPQAADLFKKFSNIYGNGDYNVPALFIGDKSIIGFRDEASTGKQIIDAINSYTLANYPNPINKVNAPAPSPAQTEQNQQIQTIRKLPIIGEVDLKTLSLPLLAIVIGGVDGFNPCALWALIALLTLLISLGNRRRVALVGGIFILASWTITFLFLTAWLNVFAFIKLDLILRLIVGGVALYTSYQLWQSYRLENEECKPSRIKGHIHRHIDRLSQSSFLPFLIIGAIILAVLVNVIELMCTINLPVIFTKVLQIAHLPAYKNYLYIALYDVFYMFDDIVVFLVAVLFMKTFEGFNKKYLRATKIVGAIVLFVLAIILIFFPRFLSF